MNQDRVLAERHRGEANIALLLAVADGMGGHEGGGIASEIAISAVQRSQELWATINRGDWPERLHRLFALAQHGIAERATHVPELRGMGSTLTVAVIDERSAVFGHAGDSRLYLFRAGHLQQMTVDHTVARDLVARGDITAEDAAFHIGRSILTRSLTPDEPIEPELGHVELAGGDLLLLLTDGVHSAVADADIAAILALVDASDATSLQRTVDRLLTAVREHGGTDDASVVLAGVAS